MTDSNKKTIIVDADNLDNNNNNSVSSRTRSKKQLRSKNIKKEVLKTLKQHNILKKNERDIKTNTVKNKNFVDELKESLNILESINKERRKERNKTMKIQKERMMLENREFDEVMNGDSSLPYIKTDPHYGCLKGGNKKTFSQLHKTKKRSNIYFPEKPIQSVETIDNIDIKSNAVYLERQQKLQELKEKHLYENGHGYGNGDGDGDRDRDIRNNLLTKQEPIKLDIVPISKQGESNLKSITEPRKEPQKPTHSYYLRNKTFDNVIPNINELKNEVQQELKSTNIEINTDSKSNTEYEQTNTNTNINNQECDLINSINKTLKRKKTYELGKKNNQINVLIPNNKTRKTKRIETDKIDDISSYNKKRFLEDRGFIKKGSNAPEFILNELYKNILLSGNLVNTNTDKKLYNYMNNEEN